MYALCIPTQERGNEKTVSVCMHSHAGAWERDRRGGSSYGQRMYAFPRRSVGTRKWSAYVCIPTQERGNEIDGAVRATVSVCMHCMHSHAGAWERETVSVMYALYAFPRRSVGTRETVSVMYAFPRRSVGTRNGQRMYAFPRRSVGTRNGQCNVCACMHSHAGAWERENGQRMYALYAFPRRSVGTRKRSAYVCIPTQERGNEKRSAYVCIVCIPTQERGNEKRSV